MQQIAKILILLTLTVSSVHAQVVSAWTWDSNPVTTPSQGTPTGTGYSGTATSLAGGSTNNGLSPGPGGNDIDLIVNDVGAFTAMPGIDVSADFNKYENAASFFTVGSNFDFGISGGAIYIKYTVNISGTPTTINQSFYTVPDNVWHTYRFVYNNNTGVATATVDGVTKYTRTFTGPAYPVLAWGSPANAEIGFQMNGNGTNAAELDNLIIQYPPIVLPVTLLSFDASEVGKVNLLDWSVTQEWDASSFSVERSADGVQYTSIGSLAAQVGNTGVNNYQFADDAPAAISYYRLRMTDIDGSATYSPVKVVNREGASSVVLSCYPNPVINRATIKVNHPLVDALKYTVYTVDGKVLQGGMIDAGQGDVDLAMAPKGVLFIRVQDGDTSTIFKILKQ